MSARLELLRNSIDFSHHILELSPCHSPIFPKSESWNVRTADHLSQTGLKEKYKDDVTVCKDNIEPVDFIWDQGFLHEAIPKEFHGTFDVLISSHVIEHLPNPIQFFISAGQLLKPDGIMIHAIPDKRFCFDYFRPVSTTGQMIEAYRQNRTRHSGEAIFDFMTLWSKSEHGFAWGLTPVKSINLFNEFGNAAQNAMKISESTNYVDVHGWVYMPHSFRLIMLDLAYLGLIDWKIDSLWSGDSCEFIVKMTRGGKEMAQKFRPAEYQKQREALFEQGLVEMREQINLYLPLKPDEVEEKITDLVDPQWYLNTYTDVANAGMDPVVHYLKYGVNEGRSPNAQFAKKNRHKTYNEWIKLYDTLTEEEKITIVHAIEGFRHKPLISIVMPVFNTPENWLELAIESVLKQLYTNWELCIADDGSSKPEIRKILEHYAAKDKRIKVIFRNQQGHISAASNSALELANGEFVGLLDHDDIIPDHALYHVAKAINDNPNLSLIYSDEDALDENGIRFHPYFKSDWNPALLYGHNLISHFGVYRRSILQEIGGFRLGIEGSQDYDLALRVIEVIPENQIHHIPKILYHWRQSQGSASRFDYAIKAARKAIQSHLDRKNIKAEVMPNPLLEVFHRVQFSLPAKQPSVSIIIPMNDDKSRLDACIASIFDKTKYSNYEIIAVSNQDQIKQVTGEFLVFLNNDMQVISDDWLYEMVSQGIQPGVGIVGAKIYHKNNTIKHAGLICGFNNFAESMYNQMPRKHGGLMSKAILVQNFLAITGGCLLIRRELFEHLNGFKEQLHNNFKDIDLCLRAREQGYQIVWTPFAEFYDNENSTTNMSENNADELNYMMDKWGHYFERDPFYNPNLSNLSPCDSSLAYPPRISKI